MSTIDLSKGGHNKFFFWCNEHEQKRAYGSCLCVKDGYDAGRLDPNDAINTCAAAMKRGNCVAVTMREEEIAAGKAIYFTEGRPKPERMGSVTDLSNDEGYQRGWNQVGKALGDHVPAPKRKFIPVTAPTAKSEPDLASMDMGALITSELKKERDKSLITEQIARLKQEIIKFAKSDPKRARLLIVEAKQLEKSIG